MFKKIMKQKLIVENRKVTDGKGKAEQEKLVNVIKKIKTNCFTIRKKKQRVKTIDKQIDRIIRETVQRQIEKRL
jgi:hypothetical protein